MTEGNPDTVDGAARRALVFYDRPLVVDLIELTLNHGLFVVRASEQPGRGGGDPRDWRPHLSVVDMDREDSAELLLPARHLEQHAPESDAGPGPHASRRPARRSSGPSSSGSTTS